MTTTCEIDGCRADAQGQLTTSGYELCAAHFEQWKVDHMFVVEEEGKVTLKGGSA